MWPHITEYCRIKRVQKSVNTSLRCLELSFSQLMTHTPVSQSIKKDVKQMSAGWERVCELGLGIHLASPFTGEFCALWPQRMVFPLCSAAVRAFYGCFSEEKYVNILHHLPLFMVLGILPLGLNRVKMLLVLCCYSAFHNFQRFPTIKMN